MWARAGGAGAEVVVRNRPASFASNHLISS
jgi:hypothetical protein